jgi:succinate dehydrogenase/fumarate reductase flavoprotein subunit
MEQMAADVVVIRTGTGGMAAVAAAVEVVVIEAMEDIGGTRSGPLPTSRWLTRKCSAGPGSRTTRRHSSPTPDRSIVEQVQVQDRFTVEWDEELLRLFARESAETYRLLEARGVRFSRFIPRPRQHAIDRMAAVQEQLDARPRVRAGLRGEALVPDTAVAFTLTR